MFDLWDVANAMSLAEHFYDVYGQSHIYMKRILVPAGIIGC